MQCPQCEEMKDVKFLVRHQDLIDCQNPNIMNVITILCQKCGYNESHFLADYVEMIFPQWRDKKIEQIILSDEPQVEEPTDTLFSLGDMFGNTDSMMDTIPMDPIEENITEE